MGPFGYQLSNGDGLDVNGSNRSRQDHLVWKLAIVLLFFIKFLSALS